MSRKLGNDDRDILTFRPDIRYIEPDQQPGTIDPVTVPETPLEDIRAEKDKVKRLAQAVNSLAAAVQAKADVRAAEMKIKLDPKVDAQTIAAMRRMYPDENPTEITYTQYKECKERLRAKGEELGKKAAISTDDVKKAAATLNANPGFSQMGGLNTKDAKTGGLRPELQSKAQIIEPLDIDEFQDVTLRMLINFLWKNFIKPVIPLPPGVPGLPDEIAPLPKGMSAKDIAATGAPVLGEEQKEQEEPEIPEDIEI